MKINLRLYLEATDLVSLLKGFFEAWFKHGSVFSGIPCIYYVLICKDSYIVKNYMEHLEFGRHLVIAP